MPGANASARPGNGHWRIDFVTQAYGVRVAYICHLLLCNNHVGGVDADREYFCTGNVRSAIWAEVMRRA